MPCLAKVIVGPAYLDILLLCLNSPNCSAQIDALLALAGTEKSRLLTAGIWLKHIEQDLAEVNAVWNAWIDPANKPVRFCVEVCCQARPCTCNPPRPFLSPQYTHTVQANLARPQVLVEVQCTAATADGNDGMTTPLGKGH